MPQKSKRNQEKEATKLPVQGSLKKGQTNTSLPSASSEKRDNVWFSGTKSLAMSLSVVKRDSVNVEKKSSNDTSRSLGWLEDRRGVRARQKPNQEVGQGTSTQSRVRVLAPPRKELIDALESNSTRKEPEKWITVGVKERSTGEKPERTEEELEAIRIRRRERRRQDKERKKREREEQKRQKLYESKSSKIKFISSDVLHKAIKSNDEKDGLLQTARKSVTKGSEKGIKFMDEEYPELGKKNHSEGIKEKVLSRTATDCATGRLLSDGESGSEWETDHEEDSKFYHESEIEKHILQLDDHIEGAAPIVMGAGSNSSYCSILKQRSDRDKSTSEPKSSDQDNVENLEKSNAITEEAKKVKKRKEPIMFDLASVLQVKQSKKKSEKKSGHVSVVANPLNRKSGLSGNRLDSSAPTRRRGKEREKPKKKKKTKLKAIILADRERRKADLTKETKSVSKAERKEVSEEINEPKKVEEMKDDSTRDSHLDKQECKDETKLDLLEKEAKGKIHTRKFRSYCDHILSDEVNGYVETLLSDVVRFQDNMFLKDPIKAKARRRYVVGLREVKKFLTVKKITLLIVAPDLEPVESKGGLNDVIESILSLAKENNTLCVFALNRHKLGRKIRRKVPVSCIGVMNYQGSEENFKKLKELIPDLQCAYNQKIQETISLMKSPPVQEFAPIPYQGTYEKPSNWKYPIEDPSEEIKQAFLQKLRALATSSSTNCS